MNIPIETKLAIGDILLTEFEKAVANDKEVLNGQSEIKLAEVIKRGYGVKKKMQLFYLAHGEPPELDEQIKRIEKIIKRLEELHNKHVTGM